MKILLLLALCSVASAELRKVSITGKLGCVNPKGKWIPMPEAIITLWEDDYGPFDRHDLIATTTVNAKGKFNISGEEDESGQSARFFISVHVLCNGVKVGAWKGGPCEDVKLKERCAPQHVSGDKYMKTGDAFFNHMFEYNEDGEEKLKDNYNLDCIIGFKSGKTTMDGLTCGGSLCKGGRCGIERSMGPFTITEPGGK